MTERIMIQAAGLSLGLLLVACSGGGLSSPPPVNAAPVANAGANQSVTIPATVTLDASASSDPDGNAITYSWSLASIPAGSACTLTGPATANPTFTPDIPGTYVAQLIVSDGHLASTAATVSVGVSGTVSLLANGSFENGLASWSQGPFAGNPAGTTGGWYLADPAPGTETTTGTAGLPATDGSANAVGGLNQTAAGGSSSVLYQDVTIPAQATTLSFSADVGVQYLNGKTWNNAAIFWGLYPTSQIPAYNGSRTLILGTIAYEPSVSDTVLHPVSVNNIPAAAVAGQTLRLAFINATDSITGASLTTVDNVRLTAFVAY
jgi:hypothetical protein